MNRKNVIYLGFRGRTSRTPWFLTITEAARREVQLPHHSRLRVRTSPNATPVILPVEPHTQNTPQKEMLVPIRVQKNKQGIVLGPIIGILTVQRRGRPSFRGNRSNFRDIIEMGRRLGLTVVVFTPEGLISSEMTECYIHTGAEQQRGRWKRVILPVPSVVYNRIPDRIAEVNPEVQGAKSWLEEHGIPLFNDQFFDKGMLYDWLAESPETSCFLPETAAFTAPREIVRWMRRHPLVYLKPVDGKAGDGIIQVRTEPFGFRVTYQSNGKRTRNEYATAKEMARAVWRRTRGRSYLIQQGIELAAFDGRQFDLRVLIQKNRYGRWRVTGIGARVADSDGITTHVPNGGQIERDLHALRAAFGEERALSIWRRAREQAVKIAEAIERSSSTQGRLLGEMSMDIGVATDGSLWFFEANAKPMKFDEPFIRAKSLLRLLHYCDFLARSQ
ncbi:MAG: YheC/YheD family protein [Tumebacillaceae bacterium]